MVTIGLIMGGRIYPFQTENPYTILAFFSDLGMGLFYLIAKVFSIGTGDLRNVTALQFQLRNPKRFVSYFDSFVLIKSKK